MASPFNSSSSSNLPPDGAEGPAQAGESGVGGFAQIARQIRSRTTDLIAIAIVAVVGLGLGRQLVEWWAVDPADVMVAGHIQGTASGWTAGESAIDIELGDRPYVLSRQAVGGDVDRAAAVCLENCRRLLSAHEPPRHRPDAAEVLLLERLEPLEPLERLAGGGRIDRIEHAVPLFVGTRLVRAAGDAGHADHTRTDHSPAGRRRVLGWSMAFPSGAAAWTVFTIQTAASTGVKLPQLPDIELPAGSRRVLSLRDESGGALVAFEGPGPAEEWMQEFDAWQRSATATVAGSNREHRHPGWERFDTGWGVRYRLGGDKHATWIDIQIQPAGRGRLGGLISIVPPPAGPAN